MKKKITCILALCVLMAGCGQTGKPAVTDMTDSSSSADTSAADTESVVETTEPQTEASETTATETATEPVAVQPTMDAYGSRPVMLRGIFDGEEQVTPTVSYQMWESDLSNVYFGGYEYIRRDVDYRKKLLELLGENGFALEPSYYDEYFQLYEGNRYALEANYVTVDSLMHTYHLYFEHLLRKTEEKYLTGKMDELSKYMLQKAEEQYNALKGTEWEQAAKTNLAFFTVGRCLSDPGTDVPSDVADIVSAELAMIDAAEGVAYTAIFDQTMEDYSQYKPRGYYDSTEQLKKYFKSMMWYGRMGFRLDKDDTARSAVLMTMALDGDALARWQEVYSV
ncbi:MAG: DUF3160 domain-containing protein, partial [Oscillospiraceae bacterium]|nr:DUF3160 domain-containing protein [Oscillospiraceae bacterium]